MKELIGGGITTYSADFSLMGIKVAQAVFEKGKNTGNATHYIDQKKFIIV